MGEEISNRRPVWNQKDDRAQKFGARRWGNEVSRATRACFQRMRGEPSTKLDDTLSWTECGDPRILLPTPIGNSFQAPVLAMAKGRRARRKLC